MAEQSFPPFLSPPLMPSLRVQGRKGCSGPGKTKPEGSPGWGEEEEKEEKEGGC